MDKHLNNKNGTYIGAKGGTELQYERLLTYIGAYMNDIQIICSRPVPLEPNKKHIFYAHDHYSDPVLQRMDKAYHDAIDMWVFVSNTQFETYHTHFGIPYSKSVVIENSIDPIMDHKKPDDVINLIYHTTPHRGLTLLYGTFEYLSKKYSNLYLDVYSSFNIYGWPDRDKEFENVFELCRQHPKINYHGTKPNSEIREALKKSHIFAYPSIWPETSCIAAIEAMSARNLVVCSDLGALSETVGRKGITYRYNEDVNTHVNEFAHVLDAVISKGLYKDTNLLYASKSEVDKYHSWEFNSIRWKSLCERVLSV